MVDITTEEIDHSGEIEEADNESPAKENAAALADEAGNFLWKELMGKDIQLKDMSAAPTSSDGAATPKTECRPQDAVIVNFVGRVAENRDDEDGPIFHEAEDWLIVIGDKYVNPALEMGVRFMHEGQRAALWSHSKFAYGLSTRKHGAYELPPKSNVRYEIMVKSVISPDEGSSDPDAFQLQLGMSKKLIANDMFKNELYTTTNQGGQQRALRLYAKAADEMVHLIQSHQARKEEQGDGYDEKAGKEKTDQATDIMLACLNNVVAVQLKAKKYHEAKEAAVKVLTYDPNNLKALLRAARAAMMDPSATYEESDAAVAAAEKVVEEKGFDDKDVRKLRQELKQKKQEYRKRRKEMMARMTKELKVTDKKEEGREPKSAAASITKDEKDQAPSATTTTSNTEDTEEELAASAVPLWRRLLPYAFQLLFPFALYFLVLFTSKPRREERMDNEL